MLTEEVRRLSRSEKLLLINDLWDDLAVDEAAQPLSHEQEKMLDERYEQFVADPAQGKPWSEVRKELSEKLGITRWLSAAECRSRLRKSCADTRSE